MGDRRGLMGKQQRTELFGGIRYAIGANVYQGEAFEDVGGLNKRILGCAQQREQFIERLRAAAGTDLELSIERVLAHSTGWAKVVGATPADRAEQGGNLGGALALIDSLLTTGAGNAGAGVRRCGQRAQTSKQAGAKFLEQAHDVVFGLGQAVLLLLHPDAQRAGQCGHTFSHGGDQGFCSDGSCGRIEVNLLWWAKYGVLADTIVA